MSSSRTHVFAFFANVLIAMAVLCFANYSSIKYDINSRAPFDMPEGTYSFFAFDPSSSYLPEMQKQIGDILTENNCEMVFESCSSLGDGLFTSGGSVSEQFPRANEAVYYPEGSMAADIYGADMFTVSPGKELSVAGTFESRQNFEGKESAYSLAKRDYCYPFLMRNDMQGTYFISSEKAGMEIKSLLEENGYVTNNEMVYHRLGISEFLSIMRTDKFFPGMVLCLLFAAVNYVFFLCEHETQRDREKQIMRKAGASRCQIINGIFREYTPGVLLGCLTGVVLCFSLFRSFMPYISRVSLLLMGCWIIFALVVTPAILGILWKRRDRL